jgi:xanthine dehydrogenase molybdopterin-binding subunit B
VYCHTSPIDCNLSERSNPLNAVNQLHGQVIDGLGEALAQEITIERGRTKESNFHEYRLPRITDAPPEVEIQLPAARGEGLLTFVDHSAAHHRQVHLGLLDAAGRDAEEVLVE